MSAKSRLLESGIRYIHARIAARQPILINRVTFANPDVSSKNPLDPIEPVDSSLTSHEVVHTAPVTAIGRINRDAVVLTIDLDTNAGDFAFTQVIWWADNVPVAATNIPRFDKRRQVENRSGNFFRLSYILRWRNAASIARVSMPAESWQLDVTDRFLAVEQAVRDPVKTFLGETCFLNRAARVQAIEPTLYESFRDIENWEIGGGSLARAEETLRVSGQSESDELSKDVNENWGSYNGLLIQASGDSGSDVVFFIEDASARRNTWTLSPQTDSRELEVDFSRPATNAGLDYENVAKIGFSGLNAGITYTISSIKLAALNDFAVEAGEAYMEGIRLKLPASAYRRHQADYNPTLARETPSLAPPSSGARTDSVYLDIYLTGSFNRIVPHATIIVSDETKHDYLDEDGYQHYVRKIAEIERTTRLRILNSTITDFRNPRAINHRRGVIGRQFPLGEIITVHPSAPKPDVDYWRFCDGRGILGGDLLRYNIPTPDLTDNRFLMGAAKSSTFATGGTNDSSHYHDTDSKLMTYRFDHSHSVSAHSHHSGSLKALITNPNHGIQSHLINHGWTPNWVLNVTTAGFGPSSARQARATAVSGSVGSSAPGTSSSLSSYDLRHLHRTKSQSNIENRPRFVTVHCYVRIRQ